MKERPILFSAPMVRALLDGRKTQTRRIIKPQPQCGVGRYTEDGTPGEVDWVLLDEDGDPIDIALRCPYGAPGDRLWVKETYAVDVSGCLRGLSYRADHQDPRGDGPAHPMRWRPSIYMPRWASRLTLEVTQVRVERLQDISEADAIAEGIEPVPGGYRNYMPEREAQGIATSFASPRESFFSLWESIHGADSLASNPWDWVVEFKKVGET